MEAEVYIRSLPAGCTQTRAASGLSAAYLFQARRLQEGNINLETLTAPLGSLQQPPSSSLDAESSNDVSAPLLTSWTPPSVFAGCI